MSDVANTLSINEIAAAPRRDLTLRRRAAAAVVYAAGRARGSDLLLALAYFGFFLNLFNLLPFGFFDGGAIWRSARWLRTGGGRDKALLIYVLYFGTAVALAVGMYAAHIPQHRL